MKHLSRSLTAANEFVQLLEEAGTELRSPQSFLISWNKNQPIFFFPDTAPYTLPSAVFFSEANTLLWLHWSISWLFLFLFHLLLFCFVLSFCFLFCLLLSFCSTFILVQLIWSSKAKPWNKQCGCTDRSLLGLFVFYRRDFQIQLY